MRHVLSLACGLALLMGAPAIANAGYQVPVSASGMNGTLWVAPPVEGRYSCPMDPDVHAAEPGLCPKCHMDLEPSATQVRLQVAGLAGRKAKLGVVGKPSMSTTATFNKQGVAEAGFKLPPGHYTFTADVTTAKGKHVHFSAPYLLR